MAGAWAGALQHCCGEPAERAGQQRLRAAALRVSQLDAALLDEELASLFLHKLLSACKHVRRDVQPPTQLASVADALASACALWLRTPRPGCALLGLKYTASSFTGNARRGSAVTDCGGRVAFGTLVLSQLLALHARTQPVPLETGSVRLRRVAACVRAAERVSVAASAANLLEFLRSARYRNVAERMLAAQLVHSRDDMSRVLSLDFLNRQLVWQELSDLLLFILPLLHSLRNSSPSLAVLGGRAASRTGGGDSAECHMCSRSIVLRCTAVPCGHRGCYFCMTAACRANAKQACPVCSARVVAVRRG